MGATLIMPALSGFLLMIVLTQFALIRTERSRRRQGELEQVKELLPRHYDAMDRVNAEKALPQEMKDVVAWVSSAIEDEATAMFFVEKVLGEVGEHVSKADEGVAALRSAHPHAMEDYDLAMTTGILASVLRWPGTAHEAKRVMADVLSSRHEETTAAFRRAQEQRRHLRQTVAAAF